MDSSTHRDFRLTPSGAYPRSSNVGYFVIGALVGLLAFIIVVFYVLFSPLRVVGDSMLPVLHEGDRALLTRGYDHPSRGDVIVIDTLERGADERVVKRVIAIAGDTIEIRDDVAIVNGRVEDARYRLMEAGRGVSIRPSIVPPDMVYVLGDNRPVSLDSRFVGPLPLKKVEGKVVFIYLPSEHLGAVR